MNDRQSIGEKPGFPSGEDAFASLLASQGQKERSACLEQKERDREIRSLRKENRILKDRCEKAEHDYQEISEAFFWRISKPLRLVLSTVKKRMGKLPPQDSPVPAGRSIQADAAEVLLSMQDPARLEKERTALFEKKTVFSILTPLYNTKPKMLREMISSVRNQTYGNWELLLADGSDEDQGETGRICTELSAQDARIHYRKLEQNRGIAGNTNACAGMASGNWFVLLDHDDLLHPSALFQVMTAIQNDSADFVYTDECTFEADPASPLLVHHKQDFAPDTLRGMNYICHLSAFSRDLVQKAGGLFRTGFDGSQDYDLILRLTEKARRTSHIREVLYYWRASENSTARAIDAKPYAVAAAKKALAAHLERLGMKGTVSDSAVLTSYRISYEVKGSPLVSIIIPGTDQSVHLYRCIDSVRSLSAWQNWEMIIAESGSEDPSALFLYHWLETLDTRIRVIRHARPLNYSGICNAGAAAAKGEYLLFLSPDTEVITPSWIEEMLMFAQRPDIGAVSPMLYEPDDTIRHAGIALKADGIPYGLHKAHSRGSVGYMSRLVIAQNLSAVTGDCMLVPKKAFDRAGRFDEEYSLSLGDIDFCLKLRQSGYRIVWTPFAELYQFSGRREETGGQSEQSASGTCPDRERFLKKWSGMLKNGDPFAPGILQKYSDR